MGALLGVANVFDRIARFTGKAVGWLMLPLIAVIMFDVVTRKIDATRLYFSEYTAVSGISVSTVLQDMQWHFHGALLMLSFGFGYLANAHVRVDIFREMLPRRKQAWVETIGLIVLGLPFLIIMIWYSWDLMALSYRQGEGSESLTGIGQRWIIKSSMVIGFTILLLALLATLFRLFAVLFGTMAERDEALDRLEIFAEESEELEKARAAAEAALKNEQGG